MHLVPNETLPPLEPNASIQGVFPRQTHWDYAMPAMEGGPPRGVADAWPRAVECGMSLLDILEATCSVASAAGHPSRCSTDWHPPHGEGGCFARCELAEFSMDFVPDCPDMLLQVSRLILARADPRVRGLRQCSALTTTTDPHASATVARHRPIELHTS